MTKHTQAHLTRTVSRNQSRAVLEKTKSQMEYYMGAKLSEMGVDPKQLFTAGPYQTRTMISSGP